MPTIPSHLDVLGQVLGRPPSWMLALLALASTATLTAQVQIPRPPLVDKRCERTQIGQLPLNRLDAIRYKGVPVGLWPGGSNTRPKAHESLGLSLAQAIQARNAKGKPSKDGRIGMLCIGGSEVGRNFRTFQELVALSSALDPALVLVDGSLDGVDAADLADPKHKAWTRIDARLAKAGLTAPQVQAFWIQVAKDHPNKTWLLHARELRDRLGAIARNLRARYPHGRLGYLGTRIYAGHAGDGRSLEPYAFESGFAIQWLLGQQIDGDKSLNADPKQGKVQAPWLSWGPYLWSDGMAGGNGTLVWHCNDFDREGTLPNANGSIKVARRMLSTFLSDPTIRPWMFSANGTAKGKVLVYGQGCKGGQGFPGTLTWGQPTIGNLSFSIGIDKVPAHTIGIAMMSNHHGFLPLGRDCDVLVDTGQIIFFHPIVADAKGQVRIRIPVHQDKSHIGVAMYCQWLALDPAGTSVPRLGPVSLSRGILVLFGI